MKNSRKSWFEFNDGYAIINTICLKGLVQMIRIFLVAVFLITFFILSIPVFFIEWIIGKFNPRAKSMSSLRIVQTAFKGVRLISGTKTTVIGWENVPKDEPVLFIGNHRGFFDTVIAYSMMPGLTGFVAKKEMENVPFLRVWMRNINCLFLDRDNVREGLKTILQGIDMIKNDNVSIVIFPEGHRNEDNDVKPFKEGSFKFAEKSGCKIIPMVQNNTEAIFENQFPRIRKTHTILEFGKPIIMSELEKDERKAIGVYTHRIVSEIYQKNQKLV